MKMEILCISDTLNYLKGQFSRKEYELLTMRCNRNKSLEAKWKQRRQKCMPRPIEMKLKANLKYSGKL